MSVEIVGDGSLGLLSIANRVEQSRVFGLISLVGIIRDEIIPDRIAVAAGAEQASFDSKTCVVPDSSGAHRVVVHLLTHLFANGPLRVRVSAHWKDGRSASFLDKELIADNATDLAIEVRADLKAFKTPAILPRQIDSSLFPYDEGKARAWFDEISPVDIPLSFDQANDLEAAHRHLERWGFCVLPEQLPSNYIENFRRELADAIDSRRLSYESGSSQRIHGAHLLPSGRDIWLYPPVMRFLRSHFRDTPCACQTLTYVHGSEQDAHQDTIHLTPYPAGYMCGVWIALEDVQPDSGELFVYPGSHKTTRLLARDLGLEKVDVDYSSYVVFARAIERMLKEGGFERLVYRPRVGQILVWHENLIHGGSRRNDRNKTRYSIVSHYFAKGSVAYYDSRGEAASLEVLPYIA